MTAHIAKKTLAVIGDNATLGVHATLNHSAALYGVVKTDIGPGLWPGTGVTPIHGSHLRQKLEVVHPRLPKPHVRRPLN